MRKIKTALISVADKEGLAEFASVLQDFGVKIISSGGTAKTLEEEGFEVIKVSDLTASPEILDGRVKTLHPKIHGGILANREIPAHLEELQRHGIEEIDMVVVNLYPFQRVISSGAGIDDAIENIDIGGSALLRAAGKNHRGVAVLVKPAQYAEIIEELKKNDGCLSLATRQKLAVEAFRHSVEYDGAIADYLSEQFLSQEEFPREIFLPLERVENLRYGENPHQKAAFYRDKYKKGQGISGLAQLNGKELSYNNLLDLDSAIAIVQEFAEPAASVIKHTNPCGVAIGSELAEAYIKAREADPVSAFGSIVALNRQVDRKTAVEVAKTFVEVVAAPGYDDDALQVLKEKKNLRVLIVPFNVGKGMELRSIRGGYLLQDRDFSEETGADWNIVSGEGFSAEQFRDLLFAWKVCKHVKSNAIVIAKDGQTIGIGGGQMSRIDATRLALEKCAGKTQGAVLASDGFFPFRDSIDSLIGTGICAVVEPGGSVRDEEVIAAAKEAGISMAFTGCRHFKH